MIEILDVGVIMGSASLQIFEDIVGRFPGATYLYNDFKSRCACDDPDCARRQMQSNVEHLFGRDNERFATFLLKLSEIDQQPNDEQIRAVLSDMGFIIGTGREEGIVRKLLRQWGVDWGTLQ